MAETALIEAVKAEDVESVRHYLDLGAEVDQEDEQGWAALNWSAGRGNLKLVQMLVEHGADINHTGRDQRTPYQIALAAGRVEVARFLRGLGQSSSSPRSAGLEYTKAYQVKELRQFAGWQEKETVSAPDSAAGAGSLAANKLTDEDVVFLHEDLTVTRLIWLNEDVIYDQITPEWRHFCNTVLQFRPPDDLDLVPVSGGTAAGQG